MSASPWKAVARRVVWSPAEYAFECPKCGGPHRFGTLTPETVRIYEIRCAFCREWVQVFAGGEEPEPEEPGEDEPPEYSGEFEEGE